MKKVGNMLWGLVFIVIGIIFGLNAVGLTDINIFFNGWWTLFIIVPSFIGVIKESQKVWNYIWLLIGITLLLAAQGILDISKIGKLIFPAILVIIGVSLIFKDTVGGKVNDKIKELNKEGKEEYYATFSGEKLTFTGNEFKGANLNAIFGGIELNLRNANIEKDQIINTTSVFGGIDIFVPNNVNVKVKSTSIFGGTDNKITENKENMPTIYIKSFCLFGGTEIKN